MARFPIIDSPCPLSPDQIAAIDGHCGRCSKTVHALDAMDDAGRAALLGASGASLCVSYRMPLGFGAALALAMAGSATAQDAPPSGPIHADVPSPAPRTPASSTAVDPKPKSVEPLMVLAGGVRDPKMAKWVEDMSLPELPTALDTDAGN